jgi:hypothetical protein
MAADIPSVLSKDGTDGLGAVPSVLEESRTDGTVDNTVGEWLISVQSGSYWCKRSGYRYSDEYGYGYRSQVCIYTGLEASRDQPINKSF